MLKQKQQATFIEMIVVACFTNFTIGKVTSSQLLVWIIAVGSMLIQAILLLTMINRSNDKYCQKLAAMFLLQGLFLPVGLMGIATPLKMNIPISGDAFTWLTINRRWLVVIGLVVYLGIIILVSRLVNRLFFPGSSLGGILWRILLCLISMLTTLIVIVGILTIGERLFAGNFSLLFVDICLVLLVNFAQQVALLWLVTNQIPPINEWLNTTGFVATIVLFLILLLFQAVIPDGVSVRNHSQIIVHRGVVDDNAEYNTIAALKKNGNQGFSFIEMDVQETKDHQFICAHDDTVSINGKRDQINNLSLRQIKRFKHVELFNDYLKVAGKLQQRLIVELKVTNVSDPLMGKRFANQFGQQMVTQGNYVHSVGYTQLMQIKRQFPKIKVGLVTMLNGLGISKLRPDFFTLQRVTLNDYMVAQCGRGNRKVYSWTDNEKWVMKTSKLLGTDGQVTDQANQLANVRVKVPRDNWLLILNKFWNYV